MTESATRLPENESITAPPPRSSGREYTPTDEPYERSSRPSGQPLVLLVALSALSDFAMAPMFVFLRPGSPGISIVFGFGALGCILAQGNALAAWLAWDHRPFLRRLTIHWGIAATLFLIWLAGLWLSAERSFFDVARYSVLLAVPLVSMAAQLPLWIVRHLFGWRLIQQPSETISRDSPLGFAI
jgi:hypothetical protein